MTVSTKWIFRGLVLLFVIATLLVLGPIFSASRQRWPRIADSEALLKDAQAMTSTLTNGVVDAKAWPRSIAALHPRFVHKDVDCVNVTISTGGINSSWGYVVFSDRRDTWYPFAGIRMRGKTSAGIFRYETVE